MTQNELRKHLKLSERKFYTARILDIIPAPQSGKTIRKYYSDVEVKAIVEKLKTVDL